MPPAGGGALYRINQKTMVERCGSGMRPNARGMVVVAAWWSGWAMNADVQRGKTGEAAVCCLVELRITPTTSGDLDFVGAVCGLMLAEWLVNGLGVRMEQSKM